MTPSNKESLLHRFIDGELDDAGRREIESLLESDPELRAEVESLRQLGEAMRAGFPSEVEPPSADFFNAHILRQIEEEEAELRAGRGKGGAGAAGRRPAGRFSWFALPWAIAAAAVAMAAFFGFQAPERGGRGGGALALVGGDGHSAVGTTYTPVEGVRADSYFSDEAQASVIRLTGLDELPAEREMAAYSVVGYQPDLAAGSVELRGRDGDLLMVLLDGSPGQAPTFF